MENASLFRPAAIAAARVPAAGRIVIVRPVSFAVLAALLGGIALAFGTFGYFGTYTAHRVLRGRLVPEHGVADVRSPQLGTVVERRVAEGQSVRRGDVLFAVSSERVTSARGATQQEVGEQLARRRRSLAAQVVELQQLARTERDVRRKSVAALSAEAVTLDATIEVQRAREHLAAAMAERYERLRAEGFVAEESLLAKRADLLDQQGRLRALARERSSGARQLSDSTGSAAAGEAARAGQIAELERSLAETELQLAENEARRAIVVEAPHDGVVTGITKDVGDVVDPSVSLALLVPLSPVLRAELYAPSRAAGFLAAGQPVLLRYEPYPYQKFGHYRGHVSAVSQTALAPSERSVVEAGSFGAVEPMYRVTVELEAQTVTAYGELRALRPGMGVEADVLLETRRLYEWVFEPLYSGARSEARVDRSKSGRPFALVSETASPIADQPPRADRDEP
jgi:membrane fusion protein